MAWTMCGVIDFADKQQCIFIPGEIRSQVSNMKHGCWTHEEKLLFSCFAAWHCLRKNFNKVFCSSKGWLLKSWRWEVTGFEHEWVSSSEDKPPSEPQNGVHDLHQKPEPSQRASSVSSDLLVSTSTHHRVTSSSHLHLCTSSHLHIFTSSHPAYVFLPRLLYMFLSCPEGMQSRIQEMKFDHQKHNKNWILTCPQEPFSTRSLKTEIKLRFWSV